MWEGFERYLKTQEVESDLTLQLREFQTSVENKMKDLQEQINKRVNEEYFQLTTKRNDKKQKEFIDKKVEELSEKNKTVMDFCTVSCDEVKCGQESMKSEMMGWFDDFAALIGKRLTLE